MPAQTLPLRPVRGPRGLPWLGNLPAFGKDPLTFLTRLRDEFGDAVTWSLGPRRSLFLSHPQHIAEFLRSRDGAFDVLRIGWAVRQLVGDSVLLTAGPEWRRKRGMVQPAVRPRQVRRFAPVMVDSALGAVGRWRDGDRFDLQREMTLVTQRVVLRTLFGSDLGDRTRDLGAAMAAAERAIATEIRGLPLVLPDWVPLPYRRRHLDAVAVIDAEMRRLIGARRAGADTGDGAGADGGPGRDGDLLTRLLAARDEEGRPLSAREVRDEAVTLWAAGHETTSTALTWIWYLLSRSPGARARLEDELDRVLGGRPATAEDCEQLVWTRQIVKESLRMYPPVWLVPAEAGQGVVLGGRAIPAGTVVWCSQWTAHRDPRWFRDPTAFRPERWGDGAPDIIPEHAWFPFGGGSRGCIGARFAQMEATLLVAAVAQRFRLDVTPKDVPPRVGLVLQPAVPLIATVRARPRP
ncbi:cytochrome P450 [Streptomyces albofaciens]|uniref:cytochrome P450 n=1 Tax=Streptomyces albofaciens TaxID=66866 RepID=UPI001FCA6B1D|nr:cytochrome P450 [Streptomyces albofaciens]